RENWEVLAYLRGSWDVPVIAARHAPTQIERPFGASSETSLHKDGPTWSRGKCLITVSDSTLVNDSSGTPSSLGKRILPRSARQNVCRGEAVHVHTRAIRLEKIEAKTGARVPKGVMAIEDTDDNDRVTGCRFDGYYP